MLLVICRGSTGVSSDRLWRRVIWAIHHTSRDWQSIPTKVSVPGPWKQVRRNTSDLTLMGIRLELLLRHVVKSGNKSLFWLGYWIGEDLLCKKFPLLFALDRNKGCTVANRLVMMDDVICCTWSWVRDPISVREVKELRGLLQLCKDVVLVDGDDSVRWVSDVSSDFSVASLKEKIEMARISSPVYKMKWNNWVPGKVGLFAWRAELDKLPLLTLLARRNVGVGSLDGPACGELEETTEHIFVSCGLAQSVWQVISIWCNVPQVCAFSVRDLLELYKFTKFPKRKTKAFHAVCMVTLWCLWKVRNDMVFGGLKILARNVVKDVKALSFLWVKNRSSGLYLAWEDWIRFIVN
ncbi:uncharacterized protein LOC143623844 [Bidens hawaiensis]|uniref:uncharacterized protein LOC143623844 n=1 Tax=Bidens hawaiensis TaxID=980011 RepID=UPI00404A991E